MNRENLKTITLVILISISIFLTYNIWTNNYQYDTLPKNQFIEDNVILNVQKETPELIRPTQFFIHKKTEHYGTYEVELINKYWDSIRKWEFSEVRNESDRFTSEQFIKWLQVNESENTIEFIFSDEIPFENFKSIFNFQSNQNINLSFDRILFPIVKSNQPQKIYFVSNQNRLIYEGTTNSIKASETIASFEKQVEDLTLFVSINTSDKSFLLPENKIGFNEVYSLIDSNDGEEFKQVLFNNPNIVQQETSENQTFYTDGARLLTVDSDLFRLYFLNDAIDNLSKYVDSNKIIEQSIDFINGHGGWTNQYYFFNVNPESKIVSFRLMINQLPAFENNVGLAVPTAIFIGWDGSDIKTYYRPMYKLKHAFSGEKHELDSGKEIITKLNKVENFRLDYIKRIFPGYEFFIMEDRKIATFKPRWYIETQDGQFMKVSSDNEGS